MDICFILVRPAVPENIGAAARAIKTMGFSSLRLVGGAHHLDERAQWLAHASTEILEAAAVYGSLEAALADIDFAIAATARPRNSRKDSYVPEKVLDLIRRKVSSVRRVAIVFGSEKSGLFNEEVELCDIVSDVPMAVRYPSLNLAQAVMIYAYVLSPLSSRVRVRSRKSLPEGAPGEYRVLRAAATELLGIVGMKESSSYYRRVMERIGCMRRIDVHLAQTILKRIRRALSRDT